MLTWLIDTDGDWVLTKVRVVLGVVLFAHGAQKLLGWYGGPGLSATLRTFRDQLRISTAHVSSNRRGIFWRPRPDRWIPDTYCRTRSCDHDSSCDGNGSLEVRLFHELVWRKARPWSLVLPRGYRARGRSDGEGSGSFLIRFGIISS